MTEPANKTLPTNPLVQLVVGMTYPLRALGFIHRNSLWRLAIMPIAINLLLVTCVASVGWYSLWPLLQHMQAYLHGMAGDGELMRDVITWFTWAVWLVLLPLLFMLCAVLVCLLGQVVASPFLDMLSERTESLIFGRTPDSFGIRRLFEAVFVAVGDVLWGLLYLALVYVPLLLLGFVPGIGAVVSLVFGSLLLSQEFVGLPMARHLVSYRARWQLILHNRWMCLGFGMVATLLVVLPGLNLLLLPLACGGGTLLYCDLQRAGRLDLQTALTKN